MKKPKLDDGLEQNNLLLGQRYVPELILFPEISTPRRPSNYRTNDCRRNQDYYPRSLELPLRNAQIVAHGRKSKPDGQLSAWEEMRSATTPLGPIRSRASYIDIFPGIKPSKRPEFWSKYHSLDKEAYEPTAYLHVARMEDLVVLQYWFYYLYNDFTNCHEGDWEHVDVHLVVKNGKHIPVSCACSAHHGGTRLEWELVERVDDRRMPASEGHHPIVYVALGSHANYFLPDHTDNKVFKRFSDQTALREPAGLPRPPNEIRPNVVLIDVDSTGRKPWRFQGRWGSWGFNGRLPGVFGTGFSGPKSPWRRPAWHHPDSWARTKCRDGKGDIVEQTLDPHTLRFARTVVPALALSLPPLAYALHVGNAARDTWLSALAIMALIAAVLAACGVRLREHDTLKSYRQKRRAGVGLVTRALKPRFGAASRFANIVTFLLIIVSILGTAQVWTRVVAGPSSGAAEVQLRSLGSPNVFITAAGLVPLILLILSTDQDLALVREDWRRGWTLVLVAALLGSLIAVEVISLAMIAREPAEYPTWGFPVVAVILAVALTVLTWGLGWRIWLQYPNDVPRPNELEKTAFWLVGVLTLGLVSFATGYALLAAASEFGTSARS